MKRAIQIFTGVAVAFAAMLWHLGRVDQVRRQTEEITRRATRWRIVERLRAHPTRLWLLDNATVRDSVLDGLEVLGDWVMVTGNVFRGRTEEVETRDNLIAYMTEYGVEDE